MKEWSDYIQFPVKNRNEDIEQNCYSLYTKFGVESLIITRSEQGITLINKENEFYHIPSKAKEVYDVSGAGDTVIAAIGVFWNEDKSILEAIHLANEAAGLAVGKKGTAEVSLRELEDVISKNLIEITNKIVTREQLKELIQIWRKNGERIVFTNGCYDIFHRGHAYSIYAASQYGDRLIVAINSDSSVKRLKGEERPVNHEYDRAYVIAALGCVDCVVIFGEDTPEELLKIVHPDVLVKGGDYKEEEVVGREYAGKVQLIQYVQGYSTTKLIQRIEGKDQKK